VKMELSPEKLVEPNPSSVGHLHTDYPMDALADRFKRKVRKHVKDLRESTDNLVAAMLRWEESQEEVDQRAVRDSRAEVEGLRVHLMNLGKDTVNGEESGVMELIEEELVRVKGVIGRVDNILATNANQVDPGASSHDSSIDLASDSRNIFQVEAEINNMHSNHSQTKPRPNPDHSQTIPRPHPDHPQVFYVCQGRDMLRRWPPVDRKG
jgi:hypothetical protein